MKTGYKGNDMANEKPRILYVVEAMGGGVFSYLVELCNELIETYDIYIAHGIRKETPLDYKDYFDQRIHLIKVKHFCRSINPVKDIRASLEVKSIARKIAPDIIHLHSSKAGAIGRIVFDGKKIPLFYTPHGYSFLMTDCSSLKRALYKGIEVLLGKRKCMTISCGEGEHKETLKLTSNADYVNNGVNITKLQEIIDEVEKDYEHSFTVCTIGRISAPKNPKLFNQIAEALPGVKFLWIGDGELREELKSPNIEITGWLKQDEALRKSIKTDVFLLTSLWEGLPLSLLESMYMKKLCIVSNVAGNRGVIHDGENGFLCHSVDDFVEKIKAVQYGNVQVLVNNAYADVIQNYNTIVMVRKYSDLYQEKTTIPN